MTFSKKLYSFLFQKMPIGMKNAFKLESLKGGNVFCTCCNSSFITFFPFGKDNRCNALCPKCGSLERHRLQYKYLIEKTFILERKITLLHVAPEIVLHDIFVNKKNINYTAIDKFTGDHVYKNDTVNMDVTNLQFNDNTFDVIICNHVLEHVEDDRKAMREFYRTLKPGGFAILQVPLDKRLEKTFEDPSIKTPREREEKFGQSDHVRIYGLDYKESLEEAGFTVKVDDFIKQYTDNEIFTYGFMNEDIYFCKKEA